MAVSLGGLCPGYEREPCHRFEFAVDIEQALLAFLPGAEGVTTMHVEAMDALPDRNRLRSLRGVRTG